MKSLIPLAFCILFLCSCSRDTRTKDQLIDAIVKAQGLDELARKTKAISVAETKESAKLSYDQMKKSMPGVPQDFLDKRLAALDHYTASILESWTVEESMSVWKKAYAADLSQKELLKILTNLESDFSKKELSASKRAVEEWRGFISERSKIAAEKAMADYAVNMKRIIAEETANKK